MRQVYEHDSARDVARISNLMCRRFPIGRPPSGQERPAPKAFGAIQQTGCLRYYDTSKDTIRFQADKPLPVALVRKLVKARIAEDV